MNEAIDKRGDHHLSSEVKQVLLRWDPIGVLDDPERSDEEFELYIPPICWILENSIELSILENKLNAIAELIMGLPPNSVRIREVAEQLWRLRTT